ncbi:MAG: hypothetical protein Q8P92_04290 [Candidatus Daviesbacteria bacterium]|nr:hypothetical protein [Candidatus Daviesbacteria bacterium]
MNRTSHKIYQSILSFFTTLLVVFQSVMPSVAYAQEATDSAIVETPTQVEESISQTEYSEDLTVIPSPSPESVIVEVTEPTATPIAEDQTTKESNEITEGQPNAPPDSKQTSDETLSTPTPTDQPVLETIINTGQLSTYILENTDADSLELDLSAQDLTSATLTTDRGDYAPTDTAVIAGSDFPKDTQLRLIITADNYRLEDSVSTDANGSFTYLYQLDGTYRPLYFVEAYDLSGALLASVSFTDSPVSGCNNDSAGANDEPGQKDLTKMCVDYSGLPSSVAMDWNWDDSSWPGNNTGDGCSLFDTDGDGLVNYSLCVTVGGNPASILTTTLYSCGDGKADRCTNPIAVLTPGPGTACTATLAIDDPFPAGSNYPNDTKASCSIDLDDVGGVGMAELVDVCSYPSSQPNSDPSDCIIFKDNTGRLEVVKDLIPTEDSGLFNLQIDSVTQAADVSDGGTTGEKVVTVGDHSVGETTGTNTSLAGYSSSIVCKDLNGSGQVVAQSENSGPLTVSIEEGEDIVCIITNTLNPSSIIVHKDVQGPNSEDIVDASQNFTIRLDGVDPQSFTDGGTVTYNNVVPGDHTITEDTPPAGYDLFSITSSQINVPAGETVNVYVVNRQKSSTLTLVKTVITDNGGTAVADDFQAYINGNPVDWSVAQTLPAGSYTASEDTLSGYTASVWGGDCSGDGSVSLALGEHKTCTITNDDEPGTLIVKKLVINDNGGQLDTDDFSFQVNGGSVTPFEADGQNDLIVNAGSYSVTEPVASGYDTSYDNCTNVVVPNGGSATCTITNNDQPAHIIVIKHVVNNNGGDNSASDFTMHINGTSVGVGVSFAGAEAPGVDTQVDAGTYSVTEDQLSGYAASNTGDCAGTIANGETKVCTFTNDDEIAQITLIKVVSNSFGGNAISNDFNLTIDGNVVLSGSTTGVLANEEHIIDETQITGYTFVSISGDEKCPEALGGSVTLDEGKAIICTITNQDVAPTITLIKNVINDDGGNANPDDFNLTIDGNATNSGDSVAVLSNTAISLNEILLAGYSFVSITGDDKCPDVLGGTVVLDEGEDISCTITNDDIAPKLKLVKAVTNDNGGEAIASEWTLTANGDGGFSEDGDADIFHEVLANETYTLSENGPAGYTAFDWDCDGGLQNGNEITLSLVDEVTCTIANDDIEPLLTVIKIVITDNGGDAQVSDFDLYVSTTQVISGEQNGFDGGDYVVSETNLAGYSATISGDCDANGNVTLNLGDNKECVITNNDNSASVTLTKEVINDNGGEALADDFDLTVDGNVVLSGSTTEVLANTPIEINESLVSGYSFVSITGDSKCPEVLGGTVILDEGENISCIITNDDIVPQLIVIKHVVNDNGGNLDASDFTMLVLGDNVSEPIFVGSETGTTVTLDEGGYQVGEIEQDGYSMSTDGDCDGTILVGETKACTITNDDQSATLIVKKVVLNDNGGKLDPEDFSFQVNEESAQSFEADGQNDLTVDAGTYTIVEPSVTGYTVSYDNCEDILIPNGGSATCTITNNDDIPSLTLIKEVINDNGGQSEATEWSLEADGPTPISGNGGALSGVDFSAGTYTLSESGPDGYSASDWECTGDGEQNGNEISLELGESATCTIENNDIAPLLNLVKEVEGGNAFSSDWTLTASGDGGFSDSGDSDTFHEVLANEIYTLSEDGPTGYSASDWDCGEANPGENQIVLGLDEEVTCTIINTRDSGTITVIKDVVPDDESLWDILISGEAEESATIGDGGQTGPHNLPTGPYTITEENGQGYVASYICFADEEQEVASGSGRTIELDLEKDQNITCIFTNEFVTPVLTLSKTNNRLGQDVAPGSDVLYTLTVELSGSGLEDVTLTDVLPNGFTYRLGSWTSLSSLRGDLKDSGITTEPTYASPGVWQLGDMVNGEIVTLTLVADIKGDIDLGLYKDLAFSVGNSMNNDEILANENSGVFVGTEVNVTRAPGGENYEVERTEERISEVLGASIELPATGADIKWIGLAGALFILGSAMIMTGVLMRRKYE